MALQVDVWIIFLLICFSHLGESARNMATPIRSSIGSRRSWSMPLVRVSEHEAMLNRGLNKSGTQLLEEMVEQSDAHIAYLYERLAKTRVGKLASRTIVKPVGPGAQFMITLHLGSPTIQSFTVIVDTGSQVTWVQCKPCNPCLPAAPSAPFDTALSTSFQPVPCSATQCEQLTSTQCDPNKVGTCELELGYMDGTMTKGDLSYDMLHFNNEWKDSQQMFYFGCGYANTGQPLGNDGIAGFGRHNLALHSQLATVFPNKFAHCFVAPSSRGSSTLTIGAAPANRGIVYTPMLPPAVGIPGFYYVQMTGIQVGSQALAIDPVVFNVDASGGGGTIVDSGSNLAFLTRIAMDQVIAAYRAQVNLPVKLNWGRLQMPLCFDVLLVEVMPKLPGLTFKFPGAILYVAPENAFRRFEGNAYCLAMKFVEQGQLSVIGNMFMYNTIVVYDNEVGQIGFAPWNCLTPY